MRSWPSRETATSSTVRAASLESSQCGAASQKASPDSSTPTSARYLDVGGVKVQKAAAYDPFIVRHADVGNIHIAHTVLGLEREYQFDAQLSSSSDDKDFGHD